jgi:hypothetical protein
MPTSDDETRVLPTSRRVVLSLIVPILALLALRNYVKSTWSSIPAHGTVLDLVAGWYFKGAVVLICTPFLIWAAVRSATRPWRYWWSALLGGAGATIAAFALGGFVILLLWAFGR